MDKVVWCTYAYDQILLFFYVELCITYSLEQRSVLFSFMDIISAWPESRPLLQEGPINWRSETLGSCPTLLQSAMGDLGYISSFSQLMNLNLEVSFQT